MPARTWASKMPGTGSNCGCCSAIYFSSQPFLALPLKHRLYNWGSHVTDLIALPALNIQLFFLNCRSLFFLLSLAVHHGQEVIKIVFAVQHMRRAHIRTQSTQLTRTGIFVSLQLTCTPILQFLHTTSCRYLSPHCTYQELVH